jgi:hypothetical protein
MNELCGGRRAGCLVGVRVWKVGFGMGTYHKLGIQRYWSPSARVTVIAFWKTGDKEDGMMLLASKLAPGFGSSTSHA